MNIGVFLSAIKFIFILFILFFPEKKEKFILFFLFLDTIYKCWFQEKLNFEKVLELLNLINKEVAGYNDWLEAYVPQVKEVTLHIINSFENLTKRLDQFQDFFFQILNQNAGILENQQTIIEQLEVLKKELEELKNPKN